MKMLLYILSGLVSICLAACDNARTKEKPGTIRLDIKTTNAAFQSQETIDAVVLNEAKKKGIELIILKHQVIDHDKIRVFVIIPDPDSHSLKEMIDIALKLSEIPLFKKVALYAE